MNISENADKPSSGDAFHLVLEGTRYSTIGKENEIFVTHNETGNIYISRVQVYPTIKIITSAAMYDDPTLQHKIIYDKQRRYIIMVVLDTVNKFLRIARYDDITL